MQVRDKGYYPKDWNKFEVTTTDANGKPTTTIFKNGTREVFKWQQTWNDDGTVCLTHETKIKGINY